MSGRVPFVLDAIVCFGARLSVGLVVDRSVRELG
jgi:hypothetical protein